MSDALRLETFKQFSDVVMITLVKLDIQEGETLPIYLCDNTEQVTSNGITYIPHAFSFVRASDADTVESASITIDNTDQIIMSTIQGAETIKMTVSVVSTLDINVPEYGPIYFDMQNVTMSTSSGTITGDLFVDSYLADVTPRLRYSSNHYKGLF